MRPKNDDVAESLNAPLGQPPISAGYRRVLDALRELHPNEPDIERRMTDTPIPELGNRTLQEVVLAGDAEKAVRYLEAISTGWNG